MKELLIEGLGSSKTTLGVKLIAEFSNTVRSMNSLESYVHLKGLIDSVDMATVEKSEVLLFFATAIYRASRPVSQRMLMDARDITSFKDLNRVALSFQTAEPEKPVARVSSPSIGFRGVQCFVCRKYGHRSYDCRYRNSEQNSGSSKVPPVVCYACNEPGHKVPECPNRGRNNVNNKSENRKVEVKKGSRTVPIMQVG